MRESIKRKKKMQEHVESAVLQPFPQLFDSVCVSVQSATVSTECVVKVLRVMDSVFVNHRTLGHAVTKVSRRQAGSSHTG